MTTLYSLAVLQSIAKNFLFNFQREPEKRLTSPRMSEASDVDADVEAPDIPLDVLRTLGCWIDITRDDDALVREVTCRPNAPR